MIMKKMLLTCFLLITLITVFAQKHFEPTLESFKQNYQCPDWFRDAKFGIWAHWGPQAVARQGDWYAKRLYINDEFDKKTKTYTGKPNPVYTYNLEHYGHPSTFGYKDIIPLWKAQRFNPEQLMALFKKAGAKYFVSLATHCDNFFLWDSKIHKWNAAQMGPKKDIVGLWQAAAKKEGLRFGVSEHLALSYNWFQSSHAADKTGPLAGVPYDGNDTAYQDLYHRKADIADNGSLTTNHENQLNWLNSITELIDNYHPDLLYSDSRLPFDSIGRKMLAHYYNDNLLQNGGILDAVYNCKTGETSPMWVLDIERGLTDSITPFPWQTDTSVGDWYYKTGQQYKSGEQIIEMLIDIVSKNGNLLLSVIQTPEGDMEQDMIAILEDIAAWISVNGEGIYGTRPWKVYGEGPSVNAAKEKGPFGGISDVKQKPYTQTDFRFTKKADTVYAFCMAKPDADINIVSLGKKLNYEAKKISSVKILGIKEKLKWEQEQDALIIKKPATMLKSQVVTFKIEFKRS